jgi:hypothetical protein
MRLLSRSRPADSWDDVLGRAADLVDQAQQAGRVKRKRRRRSRRHAAAGLAQELQKAAKGRRRRKSVLVLAVSLVGIAVLGAVVVRILQRRAAQSPDLSEGFDETSEGGRQLETEVSAGEALDGRRKHQAGAGSRSRDAVNVPA